MHSKDVDCSLTCVTPAMRNARYYAVIEAYWKPGYGRVGKEDARDWSHGLYRVLAPYRCADTTHASDEIVGSTMLDPAHAGHDKFKVPAASVYSDFASEERMDKLKALKRKLDPTNVFSQNANILPASPVE